MNMGKSNIYKIVSIRIKFDLNFDLSSKLKEITIPKTRWQQKYTIFIMS